MLQAATVSNRPVIMAQHIVTKLCTKTPALPITFIMIYWWCKASLMGCC